jgi:putative NADH-flavin reductase
VVRLAADRGHQVTAVVRAESGFAPAPGIVMHHGDVTDPAVLDRVLPGHDAVVSALGLRRAGLSPWAPLRSPPNLTARVAGVLSQAMPVHGLKRLVAISAGGVGDSVAQLSWPVRLLINAGNVKVAYRDLAAMEATFARGSLDWVVARPVTLVNGPPRRPARRVERYSLLSIVRRSEVAAWMLAAAEQPAPIAEHHVLVGH